MRTRVAGPRLTTYRPSAAPSGGFSPDDITGLKGWWDVSDAGSITAAGGLVSQWNDLSGNGNHATQGTGALQPRTGATTINSLNAIGLGEPGTERHFRFAANPLAGATAGTALYVMRSTSTGSTNDGAVLASWGGDASVNDHETYSDGNIYTSFGSTVRKTAGNPVENLTVPHVITIKSAASVWSFEIDGVALHSTGTNTVGWETTASHVRIGHGDKASQSYSWLGDVGEILVYDSVLTGTDLTNAYEYLYDKWIPVPQQITGLAAWFDASNASSITASGGAVSQWNDLSGNGNHATQGTGSAQPTTGTRTINGLNGMDFDGSTDYIDIPTSLANIPYTVIGVLKPDSTSTDARILDNNGGSNQTSIRVGFSGANQFEVAHWSDDATFSITRDTSHHVVVGSYTDPGSIARVDGTALSGSPHARPFADSIGGNLIMGRLGGAYYSDMVIGELAVYTRALTLAEIQSVEVYLKAKWGTP